MTERFPARTLRGLYAVTPDEPDTGRLLALAQSVLAGHPALLQYRNKGADAGLRREQALALRDACRAAGVPLIVND
nr:thiamine phosphate synthase [Thauera aminoaromatica]